MNILDFIAALVKALAWPVAAIVIAMIFHRQISALLSRIRKGKIGPAEFEFEQEVQELAEQTSAQLQSQQVGSPTVSLATTNPRAAILEAWLGVESAIHRLAYNRELPAPSAQRSPLSIIRAVEKAGVLPGEDVALFNDLRVLRNRATHDAEFSPSPESVIKYVQLARGLKARIDEVAGER
jgi:hypothetical protein